MADREKETQEEVKVLFNKRAVPTELFRVCGHIYWLHEIDCADIEEAVKFMWAYADINDFKMMRDKFDFMIQKVEYALMHPMEKMSPGTITEEEHKKRYLAIELLINMTCEVLFDESGLIYVLPVIEEMPERIEQYKMHPKYKDMFTYKSQDQVFFDKYLEQYNNGVPLDKIKVDMDEVEKEYQLNVNKIRDKDKRVKYRDIEMIDADTKEVVHVFKDRTECMEMTGISKSNLSQCITSAKVQKNSIYKYNGWRRWKDKDNNKYYFFREKYKDE